MSDSTAPDASVLAPNLSLALERITDGFFALDANWHIAYMNAEARKLLDAPGEILGRFWLDAPQLRKLDSFNTANTGEGILRLKTVGLESAACECYSVSAANVRAALDTNQAYRRRGNAAVAKLASRRGAGRSGDQAQMPVLVVEDDFELREERRA